MNNTLVTPRISNKVEILSEVGKCGQRGRVLQASYSWWLCKLVIVVVVVNGHLKGCGRNTAQTKSVAFFSQWILTFLKWNLTVTIYITLHIGLIVWFSSHPLTFYTHSIWKCIQRVVIKMDFKNPFLNGSQLFSRTPLFPCTCHHSPQAISRDPSNKIRWDKCGLKSKQSIFKNKILYKQFLKRSLSYQVVVKHHPLVSLIK